METLNTVSKSGTTVEELIATLITASGGMTCKLAQLRDKWGPVDAYVARLIEGFRIHFADFAKVAGHGCVTDLVTLRTIRRAYDGVDRTLLELECTSVPRAARAIIDETATYVEVISDLMPETFVRNPVIIGDR